MTAVIPASLISGFAQASIQVSTPESQGQPLPPQPFTTFLALPINDIVYNAVDGLIYASIGGSAGEDLGNSIAGINPNTGVILKTIFVGSEPTRIALSSDGTQLFVGLNGAALPLPTTIVSSGQMTATVDSSLVQQLSWVQVSETTPTPGGGQSTVLPLHIYQLLDVPATAINFDPFTRKIYAVLPSTSTTITGNSLVVIDPATGSVGSPIQVGSDPNLLSETSDGNYLYIGLSGAKSLGRFNLLNQTLDLTVPIISTSV